MIRRFLLILLPLIFSLFVYAFYRTNDTLVNTLLFNTLQTDGYYIIKSIIANSVPLPAILIYSIPGGLWVFSTTLASKGLFFRYKEREFNCIFVPLIFSIGLELLQLLDSTHGQFDMIDICTYMISWTTARYLITDTLKKKNIFRPFDKRSLLFTFTYSIVHLSHVIV